ncbi:MAG: hypothetical protein HYR55_19955 [Acidobacteria bacterium]|nr:hypothetical protein [Acidobacteriota bacterium]MBI3658651.1 hypothetical protein [Acidobacteriota bacterium]
MKNTGIIRRQAGLAGLVVLLGGLWSGPALAGADCLEEPWAEVGRFGYGDIRQLTYSPDGVRVAVAGSGGVTIWNTEKETVEQVLKWHTGYALSVAWSPDGTQLASGSWDQTVRVWAAEDGRLVSALIGHTSSVRSVAWWPYGRYLASGGYEGVIRLWGPAP